MAIERTFSMIKPDATRRNLTGAITRMLEEAGLRVIASRHSGASFTWASVSMAPSRMQLTRMPRAPTSLASAMVKLSNPPLAAA